MSGIYMRTRDGRQAQVRTLRAPVAGQFLFQGRIDNGGLELWRASGAWREDEAPHPNDLVDAAFGGKSLLPKAS